MKEFEVGEKVTRKSYGNDIVFVISNIEDKNGEKNYILKGITKRLIADAPAKDLIIAMPDKVDEERNKSNKQVDDKIKSIMKGTRRLENNIMNNNKEINKEL